jgi:16S rRNA (cytosine1402-N4)-methyltransferase
MDHTVHLPVLPREVVLALACQPGGIWVDGTVGAGGHAEAILRATTPGGRLVGCDRDAEVLEIARRRLEPFAARVVLRHADHRDLPSLLDTMGVAPVNGILLDLGISSIQVDDADRGFSFRLDGPLDMRMDRGAATATAADLVNRLPERELSDLLARWGEEPQAARIARAIVRERQRGPIVRTAHLAGVIAAAAGARAGRARRGTAASGRGSRSGGARDVDAGRGPLHPATRSFQALRIAVNSEIGYLPGLLEAAVDRLRPGGRLAAIAFHSLEDRAVKQTFRALAHRCICPRGLPRCGCGRPDLVRLVTPGAVRPGPEEIRDNPRSRSARLRCVERLGEAA